MDNEGNWRGGKEELGPSWEEGAAAKVKGWRAGMKAREKCVEGGGKEP